MDKLLVRRNVCFSNSSRMKSYRYIIVSGDGLIESRIGMELNRSREIFVSYSCAESSENFR